MSEYPKWWDTDITVFTKYTNPLTKRITWHKYQFTGCFWKYTGAQIRVNTTTLESDSTTVRIPKQDNYLDKYEWISLTESEMNNYFTLGVGDIIVKGVVSDDIDEYSNGHRSTDLLSKYSQYNACIQIVNLTIDTGIGRVAEHYHIQGK